MAKRFRPTVALAAVVMSASATPPGFDAAWSRDASATPNAVRARTFETIFPLFR
jgi:hypothetical protein